MKINMIINWENYALVYQYDSILKKTRNSTKDKVTNLKIIHIRCFVLRKIKNNSH